MKAKRYLCLAAAVLLSAALCGGARAAEKISGFVDIPAGHWADESVDRAVDLGLVQGLGDKTFGLGQQVTRAQYATLLCRLMGWELLNPEQGSYSDNQDPNAWYYRAIETAAAHGVLPEDEVCEPAAAVTREDLATMTVRALGWANLAGLVQDDCPYVDVTVNRGYIALAYRMGFLFGVGDGRFAPKDPCTREQAAAVLLRLNDRMRGELVRGKPGELPDGVLLVIAETRSGTESPVPMSPRAALEEVYAAAVLAGKKGSVALHTAPLSQSVRGAARRTLTAEELEALLAEEGAEVSRSSRYGSSYLLHTGEDGENTVVWFESEEDLEQKAQLCRLLGVKGMYLAD